MNEKPRSARDDLLIVDDLMLLLLDDDGASIQAAGTLYYTLGGAVLTELALLRPPLPWTSTTVTRASEIGRGQWGPEAVATAVTRTASAVVAASAASVGR